MPAPEPVPDPERQRLDDDRARRANWKRWGPYLADRQWATVREDYSADGNPWTYLPHDHARSRAYRWGEDGLLGFTDRECRLCFAPALWNGQDPILKERLFGLTGPQGNHGEDVKELYYYLNATPTYSYAKALYKYPQAAFPYERLTTENGRRGRGDREFELEDTGVFEGGRYFDVFVEYAKAGPDDVLIRLTCVNRGPEPAPLHVLPTIWQRNTWAWGRQGEGFWDAGRIERLEGGLRVTHPSLGVYRLACDGAGAPRFLFTDNETNAERLFGAPNRSLFVKDAFHRHVIGGEEGAVNPAGVGTKAAAWYTFVLPPGQQQVIRCRFQAGDGPRAELGGDFDDLFAQRRGEADRFHGDHRDSMLTPAERRVVRQSDASLLWSRQYYGYVVEQWLEGDPSGPPPPQPRAGGRNQGWKHLYARDVIAMPDKWEYPWFAAWDLAFHCVATARIDPDFAKQQLILLGREWYMHPNGQLPAYEFAFGDVNPPVHAWAAWRVYQLAAQSPATGGGKDLPFLEAAFQKGLVNFTWWVNRQDADGDNLFEGGFLGLDNVGVFDRSKPLPGGGRLEQADATAWMAFFCTTMLAMALELAQRDPAYADLASKFFDHFVSIVQATNQLGGDGLWDEQDGFYYDHALADGQGVVPLRIRSAVGLIPLLAAESIDDSHLRCLPYFESRPHWFLTNKPELAKNIGVTRFEGQTRRLLSIPTRERLLRVLRYLFDENEFLSPYGLRSLSKVHAQHPFAIELGGQRREVRYAPGESETDIFGGNSNWRGPIWFPLNYLVAEALKRHHHFYGDSVSIECPVGSGRRVNLLQAAEEIELRLSRLFLPDGEGRRPCHGDSVPYQKDPNFRDLVLFYEHFHGETGRGLGASHQTGWTALAANVLERVAATRAAAARKG